MKIGVPREIKNNEARVAMTPEGVARLVGLGHAVFVEKDAGMGSGFLNLQYEQAGAALVQAEEAWSVDLVVKVKEPQPSEYHYFAGQMVFTFFHLAGVVKTLTEQLMASGTTAIAYESLEDEEGKLPILAPMSAIAGNMSVLMGAYYLARFNQGNGMQLGTVLAKSYGKVLIIGDGVVARHAARVAVSMGAKVIVAGLNQQEWTGQAEAVLSQVSFIQSSAANISMHVVDTDLLIGAVLCRGAKASKIVTEEMVETMQEGSVLVDVSIDQGGCVETSVPTTHSEPVFIKHGVIHYCVSNMPGAYPRASTMALTDVTIAYIETLAEQGLSGFIANKGRQKAINVCKGSIVVAKVAETFGLRVESRDVEYLLNE